MKKHFCSVRVVLLVMIAAICFVLAAPVQAQEVCGLSADGSDPQFGALSNASGSSSVNVACGVAADAHGDNSFNTAYGGDAHGNGSENTTTANSDAHGQQYQHRDGIGGQRQRQRQREHRDREFLNKR